MEFFTADLGSVGIGPRPVRDRHGDRPGRQHLGVLSETCLAAYSQPARRHHLGRQRDRDPLRRAIAFANANPGQQAQSRSTIPGTGVQIRAHQIAPLPAIAVPVTIDGYSQPGAHANTLAQGDDAVILIEINGGLTGGGGLSTSTGDGLVLSGGNSTIRGLAIDGFTAGAAIHVNSPGGGSGRRRLPGDQSQPGTYGQARSSRRSDPDEQ